jgi:uncharacterized protein (TIGR02118 family)
MHKLVAIYRQPENSASFDEHYFNTHAPLMSKVPGHTRTEISRVTRMMMGEPQYYLMFEMWFADKDALKSALKSPENAAAGQDLMGFAGDLVTLFTAEVVE